MTGPPGVGKTRLAIEYGHARRHRYPGGLWFIDLSQAIGSDRVIDAVLEALDLPPGPAAGKRIGAALHDHGAAFVIVDNAEHVIDAVRDAVQSWLAAAPALRVLVTSRQRLRSTGEELTELAPLPAAQACALFIDRARAVSPGFAPGRADAERIERIVDRLDRMPLAIELAAARARTLGLGDLLARLEHSLTLLDRPTPGMPPRHATLRASIAWSRDLLDPALAAALAQASVFRGSFSLAAAEAVIDTGDGSAVLDHLESLVDRSLMVAERHRDQVRFSLYTAIRELAAAELDGAARAGAEARHARFYAALEAAGSDDEANLVAAHARLLAGEPDPDDAERAAQLALTLSAPSPRASSVDIVAVTSASLSALERHGALGERAVELLTARANARLHIRRVADAVADLERAIELAPANGPSVVLTRVHEARTHVAMVQWNVREASAAADDAVAACPRSHGGLHATLLTNCAMIAHIDGDAQRSRLLFEQAIALAERQNAGDAAARARAGLAGVLGDLEQYDEARAILLRALASPDTSRYHWNYLRGCALIEHQLGRFDRARHYFERARVALAALDELTQWSIDLDLALLWLDAGEPARARRHCLIAVDELGSTRSSRNLAIAQGVLLVLDASELSEPELVRRSAEVEATARDTQDPRQREIVRLCLAHADLAAAARALADGYVAIADARRARAAEVLAAVADWERRSDDIRVHARILRRALARGALVVGARPAMFVTPEGGHAELERDSVPLRLLRALVDARRDAPGEPATRASLLARVWPDEATGELGINRLKVTITKLRKLGLGELIQFRDAGYLLDPAVPMVEVAVSQPWAPVGPRRARLPTGS